MENIHYLLEIAFYCGAKCSKWRTDDMREEYQNSGKDYEDMLKFYEMIFYYCNELEESDGLLQDIYNTIDNKEVMRELHHKFCAG